MLSIISLAKKVAPEVIAVTCFDSPLLIHGIAFGNDNNLGGMNGDRT